MGDSDMKMTVLFMYLVRAEPAPNSWWVSLFTPKFIFIVFITIFFNNNHPILSSMYSLTYFPPASPLSVLVRSCSNPTLKLPLHSFTCILAHEPQLLPALLPDLLTIHCRISFSWDYWHKANLLESLWKKEIS